jgi:hypothetical protein
MSTVFEPYEKLVRITVLGKSFSVPAENLLLRQLQYVSEEIGYGRYCWNGECRYCEVDCRLDGRRFSGLACRIKGDEGLEVTGCAAEIKHNLSQALAEAEDAEP